MSKVVLAIVTAEVTELTNKIMKLRDFMQLGTDYHELPREEREWMEAQYIAMGRYKRALVERIHLMKARLDEQADSVR